MEEIRTFVAIELSAGIKSELTRVQEMLKEKIATPHLRWVDPAKVHLTLKFLGNVPVDRIQEITAALKEACAGLNPFIMDVSGLGCFPSTNNPRVIWVGVQEETGRLKRLQERVEGRLATLGFKPERRPFHAHLTLGRVRKQAHAGARRTIGGIISAASVGGLGQMEVGEISLMKSVLLPSGAQYSRLETIPLERG
ncbi:MAG: RNA 2',3'-cyclic phosphodiesterase [Anaerolineae bacterium]